MSYLNMSCPGTLSPLDFTIGSYCQVANGAMVYIGSFFKYDGYISGGSGVYERSVIAHSTLADAINGAFTEITGQVGYSMLTNGTWYIAVRDKNNPSNILTKSITTTCF
jgi:hypothetical protein